MFCRLSRTLPFLQMARRQDEAVHSDFGGIADKTFFSIGKDHIGIGHKQQGNGGFFPDAYHHLKDFISCHTAGEGAFIGSLDDGPSAVGSEKGMPSSIRSAPASSMA